MWLAWTRRLRPRPFADCAARCAVDSLGSGNGGPPPARRSGARTPASTRWKNDACTAGRKMSRAETQRRRGKEKIKKREIKQIQENQQRLGKGIALVRSTHPLSFLCASASLRELILLFSLNRMSARPLLLPAVIGRGPLSSPAGSTSARVGVQEHAAARPRSARHR